jgi:hypothetical protein
MPLSTAFFTPLLEEPDQPAWPDFSPVTWDYPWPPAACLAAGGLQPCSFKELIILYHHSPLSQQNDIHNLSTNSPFGPARRKTQKPQENQPPSTFCYKLFTTRAFPSAPQWE